MSKTIIYGTDPQAMSREGLTESVAVWEDGQRESTDRGYFEWWYFDAHFDDGTTAIIVFLTKPLLERSGPLKPGISLTITPPDGVKRGQFPIFPPDAFSASKDCCDVRIGENWVRGDLHRYELHAQAGDLAADLTFTGIVPPWRPGAGKAYFGDFEHYFAWLPAIPYGTVTGTLSYEGQTHTVTGTGYHDHNWGNVGLNQVIDHWYWGRAHVGDYTLIFVEQVAARAYGFRKLPVFMLAQGDRILIGDGTPLRLHTQDFIRHPSGRDYPQRLDFVWEEGRSKVHLALRQPHLIEATSLLNLFPKWKQVLLRLVANPYYFRFNALLDLRIDLPELQAHEKGTALYEIMLLK
ncbi:MAG: carotenoid 1,2-hydratase [Chloroflexi bacterium]|nr:carotenoid 1,2-hydratase [Chloroflexota bacterium]